MRTAQSIFKVKTLAEYRARHSRLSRDHGLRVSLDTVTEIRAYLNHGRWVADCLCNGGMAVHTEWSEAGCVDCGTWYTRVTVPADFRAIEAALKDRYPPNQNWRPGESVDLLRAENTAHADGMRRRVS